jgi:nucleoside phosphorylase
MPVPTVNLNAVSDQPDQQDKQGSKKEFNIN